MESGARCWRWGRLTPLGAPRSLQTFVQASVTPVRSVPLQLMAVVSAEVAPPQGVASFSWTLVREPVSLDWKVKALPI